MGAGSSNEVEEETTKEASINWLPRVLKLAIVQQLDYTSVCR